MSKHCCLVCCRPTEKKYEHFLTHLGEAVNNLEDFDWLIQSVASDKFSDQQIVTMVKEAGNRRRKRRE